MPSALIPAGHSYRAMLLAEQLAHQRSVHPGPLVLGAAPVKPPPPATDRDRTVSRRSKPSSRTALMGEQPNPWDLLQPQDAMSRHRGAKPCRRCELSGKISLLSPAYLLSVKRRPFHTGTAGSLRPAFAPARLVGLAVKLPSAFTLVGRLPAGLWEPFRRSLTLWAAIAPVKLPTCQCPPAGLRLGVRIPTIPGWYFKVVSTEA